MAIDSDSLWRLSTCTSVARTGIDSCQMVIQVYDTLAGNVIKAKAEWMHWWMESN